MLSQQLQCTVGSIALPLVYQSAISSIACFPVVTYRLLYYIHAYDGRIQVGYYYYYFPNQSFLLLKCVLVVTTSISILVLLFACALSKDYHRIDSAFAHYFADQKSFAQYVALLY